MTVFHSKWTEHMGKEFFFLYSSGCTSYPGPHPPHSVIKSNPCKGVRSMLYITKTWTGASRLMSALKQKPPHKAACAEHLTLSSWAPCWLRGERAFHYKTWTCSTVFHAMRRLLPKIGWFLLTKIKPSSRLSWWSCKNAWGCSEVFYK